MRDAGDQIRIGRNQMFEVSEKDVRCAHPVCGMKIKSAADGVMFGLLEDGIKLPFHKACLYRLLGEVAEKSGKPVEDLISGFKDPEVSE